MAEIRSDIKKLSPGLYIVATPIGNLGDISKRGIETLAAADMIACEDTRVTAKLMAAFLLKKPLVPYHEHNGEQQRPKILAKIESGGSVALVSDAGTPLISDPGYKLVQEAHQNGIKVITVPGPSAVIAALSLAGLPTNRFLFLGFPPNKKKARQDWFSAQAETDATLIYYENNKRLGASLADAAVIFGPRNAAVCRELTKKFEEVVKDDLIALADHYKNEGAPKGEIVVIIEGSKKRDTDDDTQDQDMDRTLALALQHMSVKSAAAFVSELLDIKRKQVYSRALELTKE